MPDEALPTRSVFAVPGMDCPTEEQLVRMALNGIEDVRSLDFDLDVRQLEAVHVGPPVTILLALEPLAMGAHLLSSEAVDPHAEATSREPESAASQRRALWFVLAINAAMFAIELVAGLAAELHRAGG